MFLIDQMFFNFIKIFYVKKFFLKNEKKKKNFY